MPDLKVLFSDLIRFETDLWNAVDARLRSEHDLPLTWFEPMQVMSKYTACRVFDIKEELSITVGGTSKLVDRIEAAGLCRRRANPDDRRSQIIELTPAGRRLLAKCDQVVRGRVANTSRVRRHRASAGPVRCHVDEVAGREPPCHLARGDPVGVVRSRWPPAVSRL